MVMTGQIIPQELQAALYMRLVADLAPVPVFDYLPQNQPMPYVVIGESWDTDYSTKMAYGIEVMQRIHVWTGSAAATESKGWKQCNELMNTVILALVDQSRWITPTNWHVIDVQLDQTIRINETEPDAQEDVRHGVVSLRFRLDQWVT